MRSLRWSTARASVAALLLGLLTACGGGTEPVTPNPPPPLPPPPPPPPAVASVEVTPGESTLAPGGTVQLTATARDAGGAVLSGLTVTWVSGTSAVVTVSASGLVTAVGAGSAEVTATIGGRSGTAAITVLALAAPSCTDCLEIAPGSLLLDGVGAEQQLRAFRVDANGVRTAVTPAWTSSHPDQVTVSADGVARALKAVGSSQITATANGLTSAPAVALVAAPVPGALLVPDEQVEGTITPVNPGAVYEPGWQYRVRLRSGPAPAVGQVVIGTGQQPIAGRVVSVAPAAGSAFDVVLEVVVPRQLFTSFELKQTFRLGEGVDVSNTVGRSGRATPSLLRGATGSHARRAPRGSAAAARLEDGEVEFNLGPFECTARAGVDLSGILALESFSFSINPSLDADVDIGLTGVNRILVYGSVAPQLMANPVANLALTGSVECEKALKAIPLPLTGPLSVLIGARVVVGVGFGLEAKVPFGGLGLDLFVGGTGQIRLGVDGCRENCDWIGDVSGSADGFVKPVLPVQSWDELGRVELGVRGYGWAELRIGGPIEETQANLLKARVGFHQRANLASEANQAADPAYASDFGFDFFADAKTGSTLDLIGKFFQTDLLEFSHETVTPLATSPKGSFVITPATVEPGNEHELGEMATFTVALAPVTYLGFESVEEVEIRWLREEDGKPVLANGRPGCTTLRPTSAGQFSFSCDADFLEEHEGTQTFVAFVKAKLFGIPLPVRLEVATATVEVGSSIYAVLFRASSLCFEQERVQQVREQQTGTATDLRADANCVGPEYSSSNTASYQGTVARGDFLAEGVLPRRSVPGMVAGQTIRAWGDATALMRVTDRLVIDAPGRAGTQGVFRARLALSGDLTFSSAAPCQRGNETRWSQGLTRVIVLGTAAGLQLFDGPSSEFAVVKASCPEFDIGTLGTVMSREIAFVYGTPFYMMLQVSAEARPLFWEVGPRTPHTGMVGPETSRAAIRYRWLGMEGLAPGATVRSGTRIDWSKPVAP